MQTKLSLFCDRVIEACWLAAAIVAALFLNFYSYRIFEADKVALLRSIALVMVAAWLIKVLEEARNRPSATSSQFLRTPLALPTLLLAVVYILTTLTSIVPRISFWGFHLRLQGTYTTLSYLTFFFLILQNLRTREQLDRLIAVIILTSWPISLFGLMQHYGLNPLPWVGVSPGRVVSTLANPIFFGAYLIMVILLTLGRFVQALLAARSDTGKPSRYLLVCLYALLLLAQLACLLLTNSRGPWLGLLGGVFLFFVLMAIVRGKRGLALAVMGLAVAALVFLVLLNLPDTPLSPLRELPYLGRLGTVLEMESGSGKVRVLIWGAVADLVKSDPQRALIGYGPETQAVTLLLHYPPELANYENPEAVPDRAHNDAFDTLATTGLVGLAAYLFLFSSVFYYGLKGLNLVADARQRKVFAALSVAGILSGAVLPRLLTGNWVFAGVGVSLGLVAALVVYLIICVWFYRGRAVEGDGLQTLLIALLSALVAHFIEVTFGIGVAATRTYFCIYAALLVVVAFRLPAATPSPRSAVQSPPEEPRVRGLARLWDPSLASYSLLVGLLLGTMGFSFILIERFDLKAKNFAIVWFFAMVWLLGGLLIVLRARSEGGGNARDRRYLLYPVLSLGCFLLFLGFWALSLWGGVDGAKTLVAYYFWCFLSIAAIALTLPREKSLSLPFWRGIRGVLYLPLLAGLVGLILFTNLNLIRADVYIRSGQEAAKANRWLDGLAFYRRALALVPSQVVYHRSVSELYFNRAVVTEDPGQRDVFFEESRRTMQRAMELDPLNAMNVLNLARIYSQWGQMTADPAKRMERFNVALEYYRRAAALGPHRFQVFKEWGQVYQFRGEYEKAIEKYRYSLSLNEKSAPTYVLLGNAYQLEKRFDEAVWAYQEALALDPSLVRTQRALADTYFRMGRLEEALEENLKAIALVPEDHAIHLNLAIVYAELGRFDEALSEAERARDLAPPEKKEQIDELIAQLEAQRP